MAVCIFTLLFFEPQVTLLFNLKSKGMAKVTVFETINEKTAGIDIGAAKIFVSPDGVEVKNFGTN